MKWIYALCAALIAASAHAAEPNHYVVGVEELDYYPVYGVREGAYAGAAREIFDAFASDNGLTLTYKPLPIMRLTSELVNGMVDFKFPDNPFWNADMRKGKNIAYSKGVIAYIDGVMVLPERRGKGLAQFVTLGTVSGFTPFAWLDVLKEGRIKLIENPQMRALQRQVIAGRIDGAYASVAVANHILDNELKQPGALAFDPGLPHTKSEYYLSSARHPQLIARFDAWLVQNAARVASIKAKYGAEKGVR